MATKATHKKRAVKKREPRKKNRPASRARVKAPAKRKRKVPKCKPVKRKPAKRKATRHKAARGKHLVRQIEKRSVERVISGRRKYKAKRKPRRVVMAGTRHRRKAIGGIGGIGLLIGVGLGAVALYFLTKHPTTTYQGGTTLPPINQTQNIARNNQSANLINYAIAGGLAVDAIIKLIDKLNTSDDQQVKTIYDNVSTTGDLGYLA